MNQFWIILIYFFLDRSLSGIYYLQNDLVINHIYTGTGKIIGLFYFITTIHLLFRKKSLIRYLNPIVWMMIVMIISTIIHRGSFSRCLQIFYPIFFMVPFLYTQLQTKIQAFKFIDAVSTMYLFFVFLNLVQMIFLPNLYSDDIWVRTYLLGGENHVQYPLMIGLWFNILNWYLNGKKMKTAIYVTMQITSTIIVFSATSFVAFLICILCIFCKPIEVVMSKIKMKYILYVVAFAFFIIVCMGGTGLFESIYVAPILEILGKDSTLTGRTHVWMSAMVKFAENPILGSGSAESVNILNVWLVNANGVGMYNTLSAHNQFLQTLVEGGVVSVVILFVFLIRIGNYIDKVYIKLSVLIKSVIIAFIILLMGESGGWYNIWFVSIMGIMIGNLCFPTQNMKKIDLRF